MRFDFTLVASSTMDKFTWTNRLRCECVVSIININNGIKEPTCEYQNYNTNHILKFGMYLKVVTSLNYRVQHHGAKKIVSVVPLLST